MANYFLLNKIGGYPQKKIFTRRGGFDLIFLQLCDTLPTS